MRVQDEGSGVRMRVGLGLRVGGEDWGPGSRVDKDEG